MAASWAPAGFGGASHLAGPSGALPAPAPHPNPCPNLPCAALQATGVVPYVVHATWTYNGLGGKRARLRDMGLWIDPPDYYNKGNFLAVDLLPPEVGLTVV